MAKSKAFTKEILPIGSSKDEYFSVHQVSPTWVLTFIRWDIRDTLRAVKQNGIDKNLLTVREPLVVENDCIQVSVVVNKSVLTDSMTAVLVETDVNYSTAIAPGDFVFVNMLNSENEARRIAEIASNNSGNINNVNDGFKGLFKVQGVRKTISVDPATGTKRVLVRINAFAFTEFNNTIYYNPYMLNVDIGKQSAGQDGNSLVFPTNLSAAYAQYVSPDGAGSCRDIIRMLINAFVGTGVTDNGETARDGMVITANTQFYIPSQIGRLLGLPLAKAAKDIYTYLFGVQQYGNTSNKSSISVGFNPSNIQPQNGRYYFTSDDNPGTTLLKAEYWNQVNAWSIINQYTNSPINELYSCIRVSPDGKVLPTIVFRQIPFTSELFGSKPFDTINMKVTKFMSLPRWKVNSSLVLNTDLGREETARINFVQYYSSPPSDLKKPDGWISAQTKAINYVHDANDVLRSGLKPYVVNGTFQDTTLNNPEYNSRQWALILGDAVMGGHLKMNGTLECAGIVDPIAVGDNLEYDGTIYHIEEVAHSCVIDFITGNKIFRTILKLSHGVSLDNYSASIAYPEMVHSRGYQNRKNDFENKEQILPGVSESQDVRYRARNNRIEPSKEEINLKDNPFVQPGVTVKPSKGDKK